MVLNNAFVLIQVNKLTCYSANCHFSSSVFKIFIMAGWEFYKVKSPLLGVKSGYFFPRKVNY